MKNVITLEHPVSGIQKTAPLGFSWTTLFFGPFPALLRGDVRNAFIIFLLCYVGLGGIIYAFIYNKAYLKRLLSKGYKITRVDSSSSIEELGSKLGINLTRLVTVPAVS